MRDFEKVLFPYRVICEQRIENDGVIGIPLTLTVYYKNVEKTPVTGFRSTPLIVYAVGTGVERIGTASDDAIVSSMLSRGYIVAVLDYLDSELCEYGKLDFSLQKVRADISAGKYFEGVLPVGTYYNSYVVPSGYDIMLDRVFFEFDKHATDGTLEKIVETWNNDFRGTKGERLVKWTRPDGARKSIWNAHAVTDTVYLSHDDKPDANGEYYRIKGALSADAAAEAQRRSAALLDASEPIWLDQNGNPDPDGEYIKVKHTKAESILDCVLPDGSPIDLSLYLHIIYPTAPAHPVPVMCLASSSEHLAKGAATVDRPHLIGATLRGYAAAMYDYGYVPMARNDHYGYFDGYPMKGAITGDNKTYSLHFYNDKLIDTAAIRCIRYLAHSEDVLSLDTEHIGVFGNSKGGCFVHLGESDPESFLSRRMYDGHHGETRLESGNGAAYGFVKAAEEQPWQSYNGKKLSSSIQFVYASCGGGSDFIGKGHVPTFISCNRGCRSSYGSSIVFVNVCRSLDVPSVWFDVDQAHTLASAEDRRYRVSTYAAYFAFAGYVLKNDAPLVLYSAFEPDGFHVKFAGMIPEAEAQKITLCASDGTKIPCKLTSLYGRTEWVLAPTHGLCMGEYTVCVPEGTVAENGKGTQREYVKVHADMTCDLPVPAAPSVREKYTCTLDLHTLTPGQYVRTSVTSAPDGSEALCIDEPLINDVYAPQRFYQSAFQLFESNVIKQGPLTEEDLGRTFRISLKIFDTSCRFVGVSLSGCTSAEHEFLDDKRSVYNVKTKRGEWVSLSFAYTVYESSYGELGHIQKKLSVSAPLFGNAHTPIYFKDITVTELE